MVGGQVCEIDEQRKQTAKGHSTSMHKAITSSVICSDARSAASSDPPPPSGCVLEKLCAHDSRATCPCSKHDVAACAPGAEKGHIGLRAREVLKALRSVRASCATYNHC
jgi:hypothetical protein